MRSCRRISTKRDGTKTIFVPDVAFEFWETVDAALPTEREPTAPAIAVEVRSKSNERLIPKEILRYLAAGSTLVIDVDIKHRTIAAHDRDGSQIFALGERFERRCLPWLRFQVDEIFEDVDRLNWKS